MLRVLYTNISTSLYTGAPDAVGGVGGDVEGECPGKPCHSDGELDPGVGHALHRLLQHPPLRSCLEYSFRKYIFFNSMKKYKYSKFSILD